jgi:hypothetical protein
MDAEVTRPPGSILKLPSAFAVLFTLTSVTSKDGNSAAVCAHRNRAVAANVI